MSRALHTFRFPSNACIPQAQPPSATHVTMDSMAIEVMTDLTKHRASTVSPDQNIADAEHEMKHQGVRLLFVVSDMPCVDGIVTIADFYGDKPMRILAARHGSRADISVRDVMTPIDTMEAVDFISLCRATVGDVVATIQKFGRQHLLVVEAATPESPARIRGIVSQTQVERQLGTSISTVEVARDFLEIEAALVQ